MTYIVDDPIEHAKRELPRWSRTVDGMAADGDGGWTPFYTADARIKALLALVEELSKNQPSATNTDRVCGDERSG